MLLFLLYFDQINAALESIRDFFQKHKKLTPNLYIYNIYLFELYVISDLVTSSGVKQVLVSL